MTMGKAFRAAGLSLALLSCGCATIITGANPDQKIRVASEPRGASVYVDGQYKGNTPMSIALTRRDHHQVRVELTGYQTYEREVKPGFNLWFLGNIVIGGLIGMTIDAIDGAVIGLSPTNVSPTLVPTRSYSPRR